jgi:hypothetical protein
MMSKSNCILSVATGLVLSIVLISLGIAQELVRERKETLRGIDAVRISVERIEPDAKKYGLTEDTIKADVELKFRLAGITILTETALAGPFFDVFVATTYDKESKGFIYTIDVGFFQEVMLKRNSNVFFLSPTWYRRKHGYIDKQSLERKMRDSVKDFVDQFLIDYLSVNPARASVPSAPKKNSTPRQDTASTGDKTKIAVESEISEFLKKWKGA